MDRVGVTLSGGQFKDLQSLSSKHVAFSLTEACPLACRHCIVSTTAVSDKSCYLPIDEAREYASQLPGLRSRGVRFVSFTGGEPLLAARQLQALSDAASACGMNSTVVTACHWADNSESALRRVRSFPGIQSWFLSTDIYHLEFVPADNVVRAAEAVVSQHRRAYVRMVVPLPEPPAHSRLYEYLQMHLPSEAALTVQPVARMGRAAAIETDLELAAVPGWPCIPNGMVIRHDATVSPCCSGLINQRAGHPFQYEPVHRHGLAAAHAGWCADPLLQLMRTVGFAPLLQWLGELFPGHELLRAAPRHPCECCVRLWKDPQVGAALRRRAESPAARAKVAELTRVLFGETFMDDNTRLHSVADGE